MIRWLKRDDDDREAQSSGVATAGITAHGGSTPSSESRRSAGGCGRLRPKPRMNVQIRTEPSHVAIHSKRMRSDSFATPSAGERRRASPPSRLGAANQCSSSTSPRAQQRRREPAAAFDQDASGLRLRAARAHGPQSTWPRRGAEPRSRARRGRFAPRGRAPDGRARSRARCASPARRDTTRAAAATRSARRRPRESVCAARRRRRRAR